MLAVALNAAPLHAPLSGVGRYIRALCEALDRAGEVHPVPLFGPGGAGGALGVLRPLVKKALPRPYALADAARRFALWRAQGRYAVFHETNHVPPRTSLPTVVTIHDLSTILFPATQERARARWFAEAMPGAVQRAARVVVPTEAVRGEVVEILGATEELVEVIHHGVDGRFSPEGPRAVPAALRERGVRGSYILYLGNLEPRKNLQRLVEAYRRLPSRIQREFPLVLCGDASRAPDLREGSAGEGRVVVPGRVLDEDLPALYRAARLVACPSLYEGFGFPLLEAMASGVPAVASDIAAHREVAGNGALLAPPEDIDALGAALLKAADDELVRKELATRGRMRAMGFTWEESARRHAAVYRAAAGVAEAGERQAATAGGSAAGAR